MVELAAPLSVLVLVLGRGLGLAWTAPAWGLPGLDWRVRVGLAGALALLVAPVVSGDVGDRDLAALGRACAGEVLVGAGLGMMTGLIVAAARQAGEIVGMQAGLAPAAVLDPEAGDPLTPLGHLYGLIALGTFLALDGPLVLVRVLVESYEVWPAGGPALSTEVLHRVGGEITAALALTLRAAAPVALSLMVAGLALGLLGRAAPALQALTLIFPARSMAGLLLVFAGLGTLIATLIAAWGELPARLAAFE
jgi:flagellar biosynthesis protein FliR